MVQRAFLLVSIGLILSLSMSGYQMPTYQSHITPIINEENYGNILYVGGNGSHNYSKIQDAIIHATNGDTIYVYNDSSPYNETLVIDVQIHLIGEDKNSTIIDGGGKGDVVTIYAQGTQVKGFTIQHSGHEWPDASLKLHSTRIRIHGNIIKDSYYGIYSYNLQDSLIKENIVTNNTYCGIFLPFSTNITLAANEITNNHRYGIFLYDSAIARIRGNTIHDNIIQHHTIGVFLWFTFQCTISNNIVSKNMHGITLVHESQANTIIQNIITNNTHYGLHLNQSLNNDIMGNIITNNPCGISFNYSTNNRINTDNTITYNPQGISFQYSSENTVEHNYISTSENGMMLTGSTHNNIGFNTIIDNSNTGVSICANSNQNRISSNNFQFNARHAYFEHSFLNTWNTNYWDDWDGEVPYTINGKLLLIRNIISLDWWNFDFYPSVTPYVI